MRIGLLVLNKVCFSAHPINKIFVVHSMVFIKFKHSGATVVVAVPQAYLFSVDYETVNVCSKWRKFY